MRLSKCLAFPLQNRCADLLIHAATRWGLVHSACVYKSRSPARSIFQVAPSASVRGASRNASGRPKGDLQDWPMSGRKARESGLRRYGRDTTLAIVPRSQQSDLYPMSAIAQWPVDAASGHPLLRIGIGSWRCRATMNLRRAWQVRWVALRSADAATGIVRGQVQYCAQASEQSGLIHFEQR